MHYEFVNVVSAYQSLADKHKTRGKISYTDFKISTKTVSDEADRKFLIEAYDDDATPAEAFKMLIADLSERILRERKYFHRHIEQNHRDDEAVNYDEARKLFNESVKRDMAEAITVIDMALIEEKNEVIEVSGCGAYKIIENTIDLFREDFKEDDDRINGIFEYIDGLSGAWRDAICNKKRTNRVYTAFREVVRMDKATHTIGDKPTVKALYGCFVCMVYAEKLDILDAAIFAFMKEFRDITLVKKLLSKERGSDGGLMDERTFESRIKKPQLKEILSNIKDDSVMVVEIK